MLHITKLSFPGLGIGEFPVNSDAFSVFGAPIAWYALIICMGMIFAVSYIIFRAGQIGINSEHVIDFALFVIPIGVLGARLYYVLMELDSFHSLGEVLNIRNGGLAIYGGIIAGAITVFCVCKYKKIDFLAFADCVVPGLIMAQAIGRWGNFMNGEAFGDITNNFLRMGIRNDNSYFTFGVADMVYVHPTFLYESLWNLAGFIGANLFYKHKKYDGQIFLMIFGWYGLGRMWIEGLRMDSLYLFGSSIRVSQALAIVLFVTCAAILIYLAIKKPNKPLYRMQTANADGDATLDNVIATSEAQNVDSSEELSPDSESENDDRSSKNEE
jgi:phosphatidylglycerol:prolipoprotein diacylglycerol transferase